MLWEILGSGITISRLINGKDMYYLTIEAFIAVQFSNLLVHNTSIGLYCFRLGGMLAFAITGEKYRRLIFVSPNLLENFFLFAILVERFFLKVLPKNILQLIVVLILLYVPKFFKSGFYITSNLLHGIGSASLFWESIQTKATGFALRFRLLVRKKSLRSTLPRHS